MTDQQTLSVYDDKIEDYKRLVAAVPSKSLKAFMEALPKGGSVLDLGCGPGNSARMMAENGFGVTATDASPEMAKAAGAHAGVTARCETFDALPVVPKYDGIFANFSLLHATRADFHRHIAACCTALNNGGTLHLGLKLGEGEERDHLGRFYTYYTRDELAGIMVDNAMVITFEHQGAEKGLAGTVDPFILMQARKNG